ncbi:MAG: anthranilate synthase component I [Armatimonadota bacterium]|nr:MAG: anthranilate synthase component I [Armatimonadota bacterium]
MYSPTRGEFRERARRGDLIPVYRACLGDLETPVSAFLKLGSSDYAFLLESVEGGEKVGRYSFLGSQPYLVFQSKGRRVRIAGPQGEETRELPPGSDPLTVIKELLLRHRFVASPELPRFCGGAVGYLSYDIVRFFEELPDSTEDDLDLPDCMLVFTDTYLIFDHLRQKILVMANAYVGDDPDAAYDEAVGKIDGMIRRLSRHIDRPHLVADPSGGFITPSAPPRSNMTREQFMDGVVRAKEYIAAGDAIQVVLSQRLTKPMRADPFEVYRALRSLNPSPYMYYLSYGDLKIIGSSPERLVSEEDGEVITRPIAGSRPRGQTPQEDEELVADLLRDEKERAEHIMLVDLGRNDIGRVCESGTVEVDKLMTVERYSHVSHMVSNVRGRLAQGKDQFDVLRACFPAGTVSGAPKIRAMEIIDELEPTRRGPYAGAIGYFSFSGNMDTAITIRTIVVKDDTAYVQVGAGIVADSVPEREHQETMNKAMALLRALETAEGGD